MPGIILNSGADPDPGGSISYWLPWIQIHILYMDPDLAA